MNIVFGKDINHLPDSIVSAIFRQEGEFTAEDVFKFLDAVCPDSPRDVGWKTEHDMVIYTIRSFLMSGRIVQTGQTREGKGIYKVS
ncbi:MAG: hypothetical protein J6Y62_03720 [Clostridia bacterium]|nr:hypothetical protein [Clostridia bacterium]